MKPSALLRLIILLVLALYLGPILIIGILCEVLTVNFWVNLSFMVLVGACAIALTFLGKGGHPAYFPFKGQYAKVIVSYIALAAVISVVFMFVNAIPTFITVIVHVGVVLIFALYTAFSSFGYAHIKSVSDKQRKEVQYLVMLETKLCEASATCTAPETKTLYEKTIRMVQNSSYRSVPEAKSIELELLNMADDLMVADSGEQANILKNICVQLNKRKNIISMSRV